MSRPTPQQIAAAADVLARQWDPDGAKAGGFLDSYRHWGAGIADMVIHEPPPDTLVDYLEVLEEQLGLVPSDRSQRIQWARQLEAAVKRHVG